MKGALIRNTLTIAVVLIFYYVSLLIMNWMFNLWDTIPILDQWRTAWDPVTKAFWDFLVYIIIPVAFIIAFIVHTKPEQEQLILRRFQ
jgi:hypothetical protein